MDPFEADQLREEFDRMKQDDEGIRTGYLGPGLWVRLQHRFRTRMTEWMLAVITAVWGAVVLMPGQAFDQPDFAGFREVFGSEILLGGGMIFLGISRIIGLIVNGARKNVTPHIRMVSAACGCVIFFGICYCKALSGVAGDWLAIYPIFVVCELVNAYRAAHDVGESYGRTA